MREATGKNGVKRALRFVVATVAAIFVAYALVDLVLRWDSTSVSVSVGWVLVALLPGALAMAMQMFGWRALIQSFEGVDMPLIASASLYFDSQLARYTPGKVGLPAVRIAGASRVGVSGRVMGSALAVEVASWTAVGSLVGVSLLLGASGAAMGNLTERALGYASLGGAVVIVGAALGIALLCTIPRGRLPHALLGLLGVDPKEAGWRPLVPWMLPCWHVAHWLCWAVAGATLAHGLGASPSDAIRLGALVCLAIVLGFLALLAPAGAGVREAVIGLGAVDVLGASGAVALGLLARGVSLTSDVVLWFAARILLSRRGAA